MAAEPTIAPSSRRLGEYLECASSAIRSAIARQTPGGETASAKRIGELLLEEEAVSLDALLAGIRAQRIDRLRACPLFSTLSHEDLAQLADVFQEVTVYPDQELISQDEKDPYLYVVASGRLEVFRTDEDRKETMLARVFPGEPVGEMGYFTNGVRSASVRALETVQLLRASYEDLTDCFESNANVATAFMDVVTHRLRKTNLLYQENQYRRPITYRRLGHLADFLEFPKAEALSRGVESVLERLIQGVAHLTDAERAIFYLVDPRTGDLWSRAVEGIENNDIRVSSREGVVGWVARRAQTVNIPDAYEDSRFDRLLDRRTGGRTHTILCTPVLGRKKEVIGVLEVVNKRIGIFDESDVALARVFAEQVAVAAECSNLYRDVVRGNERMAQLLEVTTGLAQARDLPWMMTEIGASATDIVGCERGYLFALDRGADEVWTIVTLEGARRELRVPTKVAAAGHSAVTGEVVNVLDAYGDPRFDPRFDRICGVRTRNLLSVPVLDHKGGIFGALQMINKIQGIFDEDDVKLVRAVASQIGVSALVNA